MNERLLAESALFFNWILHPVPLYQPARPGGEGGGAWVRDLFRARLKAFCSLATRWRSKLRFFMTFHSSAGIDGSGGLVMAGPGLVMQPAS